MADNGFWRVLDNYQLNTLLLNRFASRERLLGGRGPSQGRERGERPRLVVQRDADLPGHALPPLRLRGGICWKPILTAR